MPKKPWFAFVLLLAAAALLIRAPSVQAASTGTIIAQSSAVQGFCGGSSSGAATTTSGSGGIIPTTNILSNQTSGEQGVLNLSVLIMLVMLIVVALIYMVSYIFNLDVLRNMVKSEIGEIFITGIIVAVFIGSFSVLGSAVSTQQQTGFAAAGSSFGRGVYIDDCAYLSTASISLAVPFFAINLARFVIESVASVTITIEPTYFGFSDMPLSGYRLLDAILGYLDTIAGAFIVLILGTLALISIIYAIFPIFLYAGIVLRTLPWTRAAGGAFLGLFAGFYIMFPLLLHIMLGGYIGTVAGVAPGGAAAAQQSLSTALAGNIGSTTQPASSIGTLGTLMLNTITGIFSAIWTTFNQGIIGGFISGVIEPALFTILSIITAFIISFDFTEAMGDILGAPSLRASHVFNKVL